MLAFLEIEVPGYGHDISYGRVIRAIDDMLGVPANDRFKHGHPWVAMLTGFDGKYIYQREFVKPRVDYSRANSKLSRYVYFQWWLESGHVYQVSEAQKKIGEKAHSYFCVIGPAGNIDEIDGLMVNVILCERGFLK